MMPPTRSAPLSPRFVIAMLDGAFYCLFVANLWSTLVDFYLELTSHAIQDNIEVQLSHTRDNGLT